MEQVLDVNPFKKRKREHRPVDPEGSSSDSGGSDSSECDRNIKRLKKKLKNKPVIRNADLFESKDPTAGQLFVFIGKSERGKTHFIKWLLHDQILREDNPLTSGIVFVRTKFKHSYKFVPDDKIFVGYDEEILKRYVKNLEKLFEGQGYLEPSFLIFDDLSGILHNRGAWFNNFIATFRHFNIHIFIAVQYLTGMHAVSPIMREQTNYAIMFNSKTTNTIKNLYENFGQLFENLKSFKDYFFQHTEPSKVGPFVCMVYFEKVDEVEKNYIPMRAPAKIPRGLQLNF